MFGFSLTEILLILAVALVVLGPEKIPDVARMLGKGIREVRKASNMMRDALMIDDPGPSTRPKPQPRASQPVIEEEQEWVPDPTPQRDIKLRSCSPRLKSDEITEVELSERKTVEKMREVYLHIPYIETI